MCGRTACSLCGQSVAKACEYEKRVPKWSPINETHSYKPSYNQSPTQYLPVLMSGAHVDRNRNDGRNDDFDRVLAAMRWGLIPNWHKTDPKEFKFHTINCRAENLNASKLYKIPLNKGRRCVVVVEGYYEWHKNGKTKEPYFFYFPQKNVSFKDRRWSKDEAKLSKGHKWCGPRLLTIAAVFEVRTLDDEELYSFSIVTVNSDATVEWIHDRMPAILDGDKDVNDWLDFENVETKEALRLLKPFSGLEWHRVSTSVGNTRNNTIENVLPFNPKKQKTIDNFFKPKAKKSPKKKKGEEDEDIDDDDDDEDEDEDDEDLDVNENKKNTTKKTIKKKRKRTVK